MNLARRLEELNSEINVFLCRPPSLVADMVLLAFGIDLLETGRAVRDTCHTELPHKAYANARLAFETAQNMLVLATHENYEFAGALAWIYFESKDAPWRSSGERQKHGSDLTEDEWLDANVDRMAYIWNSISGGAGEQLRDALTIVRQNRKKRPDNWLHENMAVRHHQSYSLFAARNGRAVSKDTTDLNKKMYEALCRETHVRPRLDSFKLVHNTSKNFVRLDNLPRDLEKARTAVVAGADLAISEGIAALRWQRIGEV